MKYWKFLMKFHKIQFSNNKIKMIIIKLNKKSQKDKFKINRI